MASKDLSLIKGRVDKLFWPSEPETFAEMLFTHNFGDPAEWIVRAARDHLGLDGRGECRMHKEEAWFWERWSPEFCSRLFVAVDIYNFCF